MILAVLSAVLLAQAPEAPPDNAAQPSAAQPAPPIEQAPPAKEPEAPGASAAGAASCVEKGLAAFRARHLKAAREAFESAVVADPQSAAAAYYLGYALYKLGEPSRKMNANKERAKQLFAKAFSLDPTFKPSFGKK